MIVQCFLMNSRIDLFTIIRYDQYAAQNEGAIILNSGELNMSAVMRPLEAAVAENMKFDIVFVIAGGDPFLVDNKKLFGWLLTHIFFLKLLDYLY